MIDFIADYIEHLHDLSRAETTRARYEGILRRMDRNLPEGLIAATEPELREWIYVRDRDKATRHQRRAAVVGFFAFACDPHRSPRLDHNPALYLPKVKLPRRYPRPAATEALRDILARAEGQLRTFCLLAAYEGARCIEISNLDRQDITSGETLLHGKGDKTRLVPTHPDVWEAVKDMPAGPVALSLRGKRQSAHRVSNVGSAGLRKLGYPLSLHRLRHWYGTETFDVVQDLRAVQELLGHASVGTTQLYVQVSKKRMTEAVHGLPKLT